MKALALDLGSRRIGVAVSDSRGVLALPYGVIGRSGDERADHEQIADVVAETEVDVVVVGLPLSLSGGHGPAAVAAGAEAERLSRYLEVRVETFDERLTTVEAERRRRDREMAERPGRHRKKRTGREGIDAEAAAVLLDAWLEARGSRR